MLISHPDSISYNGSTSDEKSPTNLREDFSKRVAEWERLKDHGFSSSNTELHKVIKKL